MDPHLCLQPLSLLSCFFKSFGIFCSLCILFDQLLLSDFFFKTKHFQTVYFDTKISCQLRHEFLLCTAAAQDNSLFHHFAFLGEHSRRTDKTKLAEYVLGFSNLHINGQNCFLIRIRKYRGGGKAHKPLCPAEAVFHSEDW